MSNLFTYPSEQFPALTSLSLRTPQGWEPLAAVGVHLGVAKTVPKGEFTPNLFVEISRFGGSYTLAQAIELAQRNSAAAKGYKRTRREENVVAGVDGFVQEGTFPQPRGGSLRQIVRLALIEHGSVVDLIQVTATCAQAQEALVWDELQGIADSITRV